MLKRINWKAVFIFFAWVVCLSGLVVFMSFIESEKTSLVCKDVKVIIPGNQNFIERSEVDQILLSNGGKLVGRKLKNINIQKLEASLKANPFIRFAKVYADMDGIIKVKISQRVPILRIINTANLDFYVDREGNKIPMSDNFTANVLIANGLIYEDYTGKVDTLKSRVAKDLFKTAAFISEDTLWNNQIEQLYVNQKSDIEMVPRVGNQNIILGDADSLEVKFNNLYTFYKKALPQVGWKTYKTIIIKYSNQVIGVKNPDTIKTTSVEPKAKIIQVPTDSLSNITQDTTIN
ncbi:MAG: cell division protein FtsQ [Flavobacterium sp.]|nr:cell division protein FtsQ [Pedobacter sp.]